jgi:hypothetical protein
VRADADAAGINAAHGSNHGDVSFYYTVAKNLARARLCHRLHLNFWDDPQGFLTPATWWMPLPSLICAAA